MLEKNNKISHLHSDKAIIEMMGAYIRHERLQQNYTQSQLAKRAGLNRYTIGQIENGESITLQSLIQLLRALDLLHVLNHFEIRTQISPLAYADMKKKERKRVRSKDDDLLQEPEVEW